MIRQIKYKNMKLNYNRLFTPVLYDVSLRDGIQTANKNNYPTSKKQDILKDIINVYKPAKIEIGSLSNPKILPIMEDSLELFNYATTNLVHPDSNIFMLIPSINKFEIAVKNNIKNLAFITSISDKFQKKNTNKTIEETKEDFKILFTKLLREHSYSNCYIKLYISCINECPIQGMMDDDNIIQEIYDYHHNYRFNEICLSDTMGTLDPIYFEYIIKKCVYLGIPISKFSVHFHYSSKNILNIENLLRMCFRYNITKYDVSMLDTGGCSITMNKEQTTSNLTYDLFYDIFNRYILEEF